MARACAIVNFSSTVMIFPLDRMRSGAGRCPRSIELATALRNSAPARIIFHVDVVTAASPMNRLHQHEQSIRDNCKSNGTPWVHARLRRPVAVDGNVLSLSRAEDD